MFRFILFTVLLFLSSFIFQEGRAFQVGNNPFRRAEQLDPDGKYLLEWEVDWSKKRVTFNVTVETRNWVGFGLSNDGLLSSGADIAIGGVDGHGHDYFSDRHRSKGSDVSILDKKQGWTLHSAWESKTHTFLCFSRTFDTCDSEDYAITLNKVTLLWSYGHNDNEEGRHPQNQGIFHTHLLDPDYAPQIIREEYTGNPTLITKDRNEAVPADTKTWTIHRYLKLESNETSYICSIHKAPRLRKKNHWIGFEINFRNEQSRAASHHMVLFRCNPPLGYNAREFFEPHLNNPGEPCYTWRNPSADLRFPIQFCTRIYSEWAIGAQSFFLPNHVGQPFAESPDEYYMLQIHYDNPARQPNLRVDLRLDNFYTDHLRPHDGGTINISHDNPNPPEDMLIPPYSTDTRFFTHCSSECTRKMLPPSGITITSVTLHQHNAGIGVRLRHFRRGKELPWILYDDNYSNLVQPFRHLVKEVKVLPGDQLTVDCRCATNESSALSGFSTRQEMCSLVAVYYNRIEDFSLCQSGLKSEEARKRFLGVGNLTWTQDELEWIVRTPRKLRGLKMSQVSDHFIDWTPDRRAEFQRFHEVAPHTGHCSAEWFTRSLEEVAVIEAALPHIGVPAMGPIDTPKDWVGPVSYPLKAVPYKPPPSPCKSKIG